MASVPIISWQIDGETVETVTYFILGGSKITSDSDCNQEIKRLLISWLQSPPAVILEPQKIKSDTVSTVSPSISHEVMGPGAMILVF